MAALRRFYPAHILPELYRLPRVAAGQGGPVGPWQVPGDTLGPWTGLGNVDVALQNTVAEGVIQKQIQTLFIRKHTFPLFWGNIFNRRIRTEE